MDWFIYPYLLDDLYEHPQSGQVFIHDLDNCFGHIFGLLMKILNFLFSGLDEFRSKILLIKHSAYNCLDRVQSKILPVLPIIFIMFSNLSGLPLC